MITYEFTFNRANAALTEVKVPVADDFGEAPVRAAVLAMAHALADNGFLVSPVQRHEVRHVWQTVTNEVRP